MKKIILLLLVCLILTSCKPHEEVPQPKTIAEVKTAQAEIADLALTVQAPATVFPQEQVNIAARITARIVKLNVRKGDIVRAGQILAVLESRDVVAQQSEAKAAISEAEANLQKTTGGTVPTDLERARGQVEITRATLNQAQKNYDRRKGLFEKGAIAQRDLLASETDLTQAKSGYEVALKALELLQKQSSDKDIRSAQSRLEQAQARWEGSAAQLAFTTLRSPFAGVITEQMMYPGDLAKPDAPIFTVMNLSTAIARMQIPEAALHNVRQGQACSLMLTEQKETAFAGRVTTINQVVDAARRTVEVWCEIANAQRHLKSGDFGAVQITTGTVRQSVVVPVAAVQFAEGSQKGLVMVVDEKHIAHANAVEVGETIAGRVRIVSGLTGGETVIVEGGYHLPDGTEVKTKTETDEKGKQGEKEKGGK